MSRNSKHIITLTLILFASFFVDAKVVENKSLESAVDFVHYKAKISPDFTAKSLNAEVDISFKPLINTVKSLTFSAKYKHINSVSLGKEKLGFVVIDEVVTIYFPQALQQNELHTLTVNYKASPQRGMKFYDDHLFTVYHTKNWLVSHPALSDKATFDLYLTHNKQHKSVGNGRLVSQSVTDKEQLVSHWQQTTPIPLYVFGFAVGDFDKLTVKTDSSKINVLFRNKSVSGLTPEMVKEAYKDVADMLLFFNDKAGTELSSDYTYVVVNGYMAQEASGFSLVGEKFVHTLLKNPSENWFIAHELAHEWWGNSITSTNFSHFWLNEGLVVYLVAAYKQHLFGQQAYNNEINLAMRRVQRAVKENRVAPVAFRNVINESEINRTMAYSKGALVFHMLREKLGDKLFWQALKHYSKIHQGGSVTTQNLQETFEQVAKTDLKEFFETWVYGEKIPNIKL